jgi:hypothetical protein
MTIAIKAIVICPPLLEKKPPALGLLFGIVMTFSIIETSLRGAATQPVEPPACFCARLRVHRRKRNSERCAIQQMTQPEDRFAQVSSPSRKSGIAVQNELHLSEALALTKGHTNILQHPPAQLL